MTSEPNKLKQGSSTEPSETSGQMASGKTATKPRRGKTQAVKAVTPAAVEPVKSPAKSSPVATAEAEKGKTGHKPKLVRDSFKIPQQEYIAFHALKARCLNAGLVVKKSELVRAGLVSLLNLSDEQLVEVISSLEKLKAGRPAQ